MIFLHHVSLFAEVLDKLFGLVDFSLEVVLVSLVGFVEGLVALLELDLVVESLGLGVDDGGLVLVEGDFSVHFVDFLLDFFKFLFDVAVFAVDVGHDSVVLLLLAVVGLLDFLEYFPLVLQVFYLRLQHSPLFFDLLIEVFDHS